MSNMYKSTNKNIVQYLLGKVIWSRSFSFLDDISYIQNLLEGAACLAFSGYDSIYKV